MIKRLTISMILVVECAVSAMAATVYCDSTTVSGQKIYFTVSGTNATITNESATNKPTEAPQSYTGSITIPDTVTNGSFTYTVTAIGSYAFYACTELNSINLSACTALDSIGYCAFYNTSLASVKLPSSLTIIDSRAFQNTTTLKSIDMSTCTKLDSIGSYAFYYCTSLDSIDMSKNVVLRSIGKYAFWKCTALKSVKLPSSLTLIYDNIFNGCTSLTSIDLSACTKLTSISNTFNGCTSLTSVKLPSSLTTIGASTFYNCTSLTSIEGLSSCIGLTSIGTYAFCNTALASIDLSACTDLTLVDQSTFRNMTSLTNIDLPSSVTQINNYAFAFCTALDSIALPESLKSISFGVFYDCTSLKTIKCKATSVPDAESSTVAIAAFYNCSALSKIYVRPYLLADYQGFETTASHAVWETPNDSVYYPYYDLTVGDAGAATLCLPFTSTIPDGVKLYTLDKVTTSTNKYVVGGTDITDDADTLTYDRPVYVTAEAGTYEFLGYYGGSDTYYHLSETTETATEGVLTGVYQDTKAEAGVYVLQDQGDGAQFYPVKSGSSITIGQFRAYLTYDEDSSAKSISFGFNDADADDDNQTTDISGVSVAESSLDAVYTLQGVRVAADNLQRGIYIRGGKKFVVK